MASDNNGITKNKMHKFCKKKNNFFLIKTDINSIIHKIKIKNIGILNIY